MRVCMIEARGHGHTLKCGRSLTDQFTVNDQANFKAQVSGMFKVEFGEWPETFTERVVETGKF